MRRRRWSDLPPELLHEIAGRLHVASDFVRSNAVCKPWRSSHEQSCARNKTTDQFLPWLLAPDRAPDGSLEMRCVFSKSSYLARPPISCRGRDCVASADGTAVCYLDGPTLHDPLTGTPLMHLPLLVDGQWHEYNPWGIIYDDGTVLLYRAYYIRLGGALGEVKAALLRPGDDKWTVIKRTLESPNHREFCVTYHGGKILLTVERGLWHVIPMTKTPATASDDDDVLLLRPSSMPPPDKGNLYEYSHVLESRGELLWVLVYSPDECRKRGHGIARVGSVSVHALKGAQWVRKEGNTLADRVFFLGRPNSFAVDATQLGVAGGFVYFMYDVDKGSDSIYERRGLFKYNLINNTTEFVDRLPGGCDGTKCTWLIPQPIIAPIHQD